MDCRQNGPREKRFCPVKWQLAVVLTKRSFNIFSFFVFVRSFSAVFVLFFRFFCKISNFNWPRLGGTARTDGTARTGPSRGQLKFEIFKIRNRVVRNGRSTPETDPKRSKNGPKPSETVRKQSETVRNRPKRIRNRPKPSETVRKASETVRKRSPRTRAECNRQL